MDDETRKKMNVEETFAAIDKIIGRLEKGDGCLLYTSPSPRDTR